MFTTGYFALNLEETVRLHSLVSSEPVYYYLFSYRGSLSLSSKFGDAIRDYGKNIFSISNSATYIVVIYIIS